MPSSINLKRMPGESELMYVYRIGSMKDSGIIDMTWAELADIFNKELRDPSDEWSESTYRKKYRLCQQYRDEFSSDVTESDDAKELRELRRELEKERVKIRDERNEYRRLIREQARQDSFLEQIYRTIAEFEYKPLPEVEKCVECYSSCGMLIPLYDFHYGLQVDNWFNKYNGDVVHKRLQKYLNRIKEIQGTHSCTEAHVVISEILAGVIHTGTRLDSNQNVIEQFLNASNHIAWFLRELSTVFQEIDVYVAPGNHSRIFPKKEENRKGENMDHLLLPLLEAKLQLIDNVKFNFNDIDESIALFSIYGNSVVAAHGDLDSPETILRNMTEMLGIQFKIALLGHKHTNQYITVNGGQKVIQTGSISGVDNYCIQHRLKGQPEQAVSIIDKNGLRCIYDVSLD